MRNNWINIKERERDSTFWKDSKYNYSSIKFQIFFINTNKILLIYEKTMRKYKEYYRAYWYERNAILKTSINHSILCNIFLKKTHKKKEKNIITENLYNKRTSSTNHNPTFSTIKSLLPLKVSKKKKWIFPQSKRINYDSNVQTIRRILPLLALCVPLSVAHKLELETRYSTRDDTRTDSTRRAEWTARAETKREGKRGGAKEEGREKRKTRRGRLVSWVNAHSSRVYGRRERKSNVYIREHMWTRKNLARTVKLRLFQT